MTYTINYFTDENRMSDGFTISIDSMSATQAVLDVITMLADYDEGTKGYEDYLKIVEVSVSDDSVNVSAYRVDATAWEVHVYIDEQDEAFNFTTNR